MARIDRGPDDPVGNDNELVFERLLDFPVDKVWAAWSSPQALEKWWGPHGTHSVIHQMEFKTGGLWKLNMMGPQGIERPSTNLFLEVTPHQRIVFRYVNSAGTTFDAQWTFTSQGEKTIVQAKLIFESPEVRQFMVDEFAADKLGDQTLDRLAEYLASS